MGVKKNYKGYCSFDYLEAGKDFKHFEPVQSHTPFQEHPMALTAEQDRRVQELAEKLIMISLREHPHLSPANIDEKLAYGRQVRVATAYEALADSYWGTIFDNFMETAPR